MFGVDVRKGREQMLQFTEDTYGGLMRPKEEVRRE